MIAWLDNSHYNTPLERIHGGMHFSHTALVDFGGEILPAYVKIYPHGSGGIVGEAIGYVAAKRSHIPAPSHAAVVEISPLDLAGFNPPEWIVNGPDVIPAWACASLPGRTLEQLIHAREDDDELWLAVLANRFGPAITVLDEWIANRDRNGGALIRKTKNAWSVIDHGEALGSHQWPIMGPFDGGTGELMRHAQRLLSPADLDTFKDRFIAAADFVFGMTADIHPMLLDLLDLLALGNHQHRLGAFLSRRESAEWLADRADLLL